MKTSHANLMRKLQKLTAECLNIGAPKVQYIESVCTLLRQSRLGPDGLAFLQFCSGWEEELVFCDIDEIREEPEEYRIESAWQSSIYFQKTHSAKRRVGISGSGSGRSRSSVTSTSSAIGRSSGEGFADLSAFTGHTSGNAPPGTQGRLEGELPARP